MNILGDLAGEFSATLKLLKKMPKGPIISLGDIIDRGEESKEMLNFFIKNNHKVILGNHEHMFKDFLMQSNLYNDKYFSFLFNGGIQTLQSFFPARYQNHLNKIDLEIERMDRNKKFDNLPKITKELYRLSLEHIDYNLYLNFLDSLPRIIETHKYYLTHAPLFPHQSIQKSTSSFDNKSSLWNRSGIKKRKKIQIFGHQGGDLKRATAKIYHDNNNHLIGMCLDTTYQERICGFNTENNKLYYQDF